MLRRKPSAKSLDLPAVTRLRIRSGVATAMPMASRTGDMTRLLKTLLLWLLMAALPIQTMAAVAQSACGLAEHGASTEVAMSAHHHDGMAMSGHAAMAADAAMASHAPADHPHGTVHKHTACTACAACCSGAVAPPALVLPGPAGTGSFAVVLAPSPLATGFIPAALERPPKSLTA